MSSRIDHETVRWVAHLARLTVCDEEVARFAEQLTSILSYVDQLNEVDTSDVAPTAHPLSVSNVFREDVARPSLGSSSALANAPESQDSFFRVPKVLDQEST